MRAAASQEARHLFSFFMFLSWGRYSAAGGGTSPGTGSEPSEVSGGLPLQRHLRRLRGPGWLFQEGA